MQPIRAMLLAAAASLPLAAAPATANVQCAAVSPGEAGREQFVVFFAVGSAQLDAQAQAVVQRAARQATATFRNEICLIGRTSPTGSPQANQRLAQQRIAAVRTALTQRGVRRETLGGFAPGPAFGRQARAENRSDRSVTIIFVR